MATCPCPKHLELPKKKRGFNVIIEDYPSGDAIYHGGRACIDTSKTGQAMILATRDPNDPLNKKVDTTLLNSDDDFFKKGP